MNIENKSNKNNNYKRKIQIINDDKIVYNISTNNKNFIKSLRKYERHTDGWNVMGHYRTLKNGKKIWINPYHKGCKQNEGKKFVIK